MEAQETWVETWERVVMGYLRQFPEWQRKPNGWQFGSETTQGFYSDPYTIIYAPCPTCGTSKPLAATCLQCSRGKGYEA